MRLYNSLGKQIQEFKSQEKGQVKIFTCGPSVYLRPHIGNYRTFLYEDILIRYLEYQGYNVQRSINITDIEDKAVQQAIKEQHDVFAQTAPAKKQFLEDLVLLNMKEPIIGMTSTSIKQAIDIIEILIKKGFAYNYQGSIFFDPLKDQSFGKLYGLDKSKWPKTKRRYKLDTYNGMRWNLGDFILWHKADEESINTQAAWDSPWGKGRPSWNIQDPAIVFQTLGEQIDINCGGIDNIIRHHDYNIAIMESAFNKPFAQYYMHGAHLYIEGKKMSKSLGNIYYPSDLIKQGYTGEDIRFFLIAEAHYRKKLNFTTKTFNQAIQQKKDLLQMFNKLLNTSSSKITFLPQRLIQIFEKHMNEDLNVKKAVQAMIKLLKSHPGVHISEQEELKSVAKKIESVLQIGLIHY